MIDSKVKKELSTRKEILNKHLAKFNQLKNECKWSEAWGQLLVTLNCAKDTLEYSANLLKNISQKMPQLSPEQKKKIETLTSTTKSTNSKQKKMIVIPRNNTKH